MTAAKSPVALDFPPGPARRGRGARSGDKQEGTAVTRTYDALRALILSYEIKPNERLNEVELAARFNVSRTPLREALNRLVVERLLRFEPSLGFYRPKIDVQEIVNLYEFRVMLETEGVKLAVERATDDEIAEVTRFWKETFERRASVTRVERITNDEQFHERVAALGHNEELVHALKTVNARIHFIRWAAPQGGDEHEASYHRHLELLTVLGERDQTRAIEVLRAIIVMRQEEIVAILKEGAAKLYLANV
ncbi:GntR family transcriptional regulator [Zavarzinia sp.]|uniref:GntR family transcriptional regulator n=1 Tax=Zavarzinia sp. TaxID=2027920 RepID=UPI003BB51A88|nr:GntR family transcriptional regulator [Zavarzinia sp.]